MGEVLQFPKKETFINQIGSHLPSEFRDDVSLIYDDIILKLNNSPTLEITASSSQLEAVNKFKEEYRSTMLSLNSELLIEKVKACAIKHGLTVKT